MKKIIISASFAMALTSTSAMAGWMDGIPGFLGNTFGPMISKAMHSDGSQDVDVSAFDEQNEKARKVFVGKLERSGLDDQAKQQALEDFENSMDKTAFAEQWK